MKNYKKQNIEVIRKDFLNMEEIFLIKYIDSFNRDISKKWQAKNLLIFSDN